jgi:hypothetical protein
MGKAHPASQKQITRLPKRLHEFLSFNQPFLFGFGFAGEHARPYLLDTLIAADNLFFLLRLQLFKLGMGQPGCSSLYLGLGLRFFLEQRSRRRDELIICLTR